MGSVDGDDARGVGRPKKDVETSSMKLEKDAYELARKAAAIYRESIITYASRLVREHASQDLLADAKRQIAEAEERGATVFGQPDRGGARVSCNFPTPGSSS